MNDRFEMRIFVSLRGSWVSHMCLYQSSTELLAEKCLNIVLLGRIQRVRAEFSVKLFIHKRKMLDRLTALVYNAKAVNMGRIILKSQSSTLLHSSIRGFLLPLAELQVTT